MQFNDSLPQAVQDRSAKISKEISVADSLLGLNATKEIVPAVDIHECPSCRYTLEELERTGLFGCPECYVTFANGLVEILKEVHGGATRHAGKVPAHYARTLARNAEAKV